MRKKCTRLSPIVLYYYCEYLLRFFWIRSNGSEGSHSGELEKSCNIEIQNILTRSKFFAYQIILYRLQSILSSTLGT